MYVESSKDWPKSVELAGLVASPEEPAFIMGKATAIQEVDFQLDIKTDESVIWYEGIATSNESQFIRDPDALLIGDIELKIYNVSHEVLRTEDDVRVTYRFVTESYKPDGFGEEGYGR